MLIRPGCIGAIGRTRNTGGGGGLTALSMRRTTGLADLTLPSPYSGIGPEMVHPSVVYIPAGWNGYNYWMAITPYPGANDDYENPCILASNDSVTWVAPPGVTNPIVPMPADPVNQYNSDCHLLLNHDGTKLLMIYRLFDNGTEKLLLLDSSDGVTWTTPQVIYSTNALAQRLVSPSMWWDGSRYVIVAVDIIPAGRPLKRLANTGSDPYAGWPGSATDVTMVHPSGGNWWHSFMVRLPSGKIMGLTQDGSSAGGNLYLTDSADNGQTFSVAEFDMTGGYYRSCFVVTSFAGDGAGILFAGRINPSFKVQRALIQFDRQNAVAAADAFINDTIAAASSTTWADDFARADSAVSLSLANSGQSYTVDTGSLGISSGRAYNPTPSNSRGLINLGTGGQNIHMAGQLQTLGTQAWFIFRAVDASNFWRLGLTSGNMRLQKIVGGSVATDIVAQPGVGSATSILEVYADSTSIRVFANATILAEVAETPGATETKVGIQASGASASYFERVAAQKI